MRNPMPARSFAATTSRRDKVPLTAWLLLLLRDGESYGRALLGRLSDRGISVDAGLAYRTLRALERDGAVTSRWTEPQAGPRRRSYRLTRKGRRRLAELATDITATWQLHETFLRGYQRAHAGHASTSSELFGSEEPHEPSEQSNGDEHLPVDGSDHAGHDAAPPRDAPAPTVGRELLAAWLLVLLLEREASYGYELRRALEEHRVRADPGALYRVLRELDRKGWLQSRWRRPAGGPRRRFYRLTPEGRRNLDELAAVITASRDSHTAFLNAYRQKATKRRPRRRPDPAT